MTAITLFAVLVIVLGSSGWYVWSNQVYSYNQCGTTTYTVTTTYGWHPPVVQCVVTGTSITLSSPITICGPSGCTTMTTGVSCPYGLTPEWTGSSWVCVQLPPLGSTTSSSSISLRDVGLCASICIYPSPELSATIFVNGSVPLSTLHLFINGTDEGITTPANTMTNYALLFKATPNNPAMPIIAGKTYAIVVVARFQDNSTSTASATVVAGSG